MKVDRHPSWPAHIDLAELPLFKLYVLRHTRKVTSQDEVPIRCDVGYGPDADHSPGSTGGCLFSNHCCPCGVRGCAAVRYPFPDTEVCGEGGLVYRSCSGKAVRDDDLAKLFSIGNSVGMIVRKCMVDDLGILNQLTYCRDEVRVGTAHLEPLPRADNVISNGSVVRARPSSTT